MANVDALEVGVAQNNAEIAAALMWAYGVSAISQEATGDDRVLLRSDVPQGGLDALAVALRPYNATVNLAQVDDGLDSWRPFAQVVRAGQHLVIWPPWIELGDINDQDIVISLDPGGAWGHGAHPTTVACLAELENVFRHQPHALTVLDFGCGSGALSVAAAALGAEHVSAVDIDPAALEATQFNATANGVAERIKLSSSTETVEPVDIVVANIGAQTLIEVSDTAKALLKPGGTIIMSGILHPIPTDVLSAYTPLKPQNETTIGKWVCLTLR